MTEKFDIYNAQKVKIGTGHPRGLSLPDGQYRFIATVVIYNSKGEILLQKRAADKESWPNYWTFAASGSVIAGETVAEGAARELREELGIALDLTLQTEEVADARWFSESEFLTLLENGQAVPHIYAKEIFNYIKSDDEYLKK
ncbi:MAG: NUDIX domain-containing protein [Streptococcaceae bacterium]|nr:NUDIX domain-containing protein [Streptococcaceae bacterium]